MYKVVNKKFKNWDSRRWGKALVCLEDEYGGQSVFTTDDHCLVLLNGSDDREFELTSHWYPEALEALKDFLTKNSDLKKVLYNYDILDEEI